MACPFVGISEILQELFVKCMNILEVGGCKEKYGQRESDAEAEARAKQLEANLEDSGRCQTKAGVGLARNKRAIDQKPSR